MATRRQTKKNRGGGPKRHVPFHTRKSGVFPPKQRSSSSHKSPSAASDSGSARSSSSHSAASDSDSLRYVRMSETESQIERKSYNKLKPSSEGSITPTDAKHDQEKSYLEQLIESSGVDRTTFINYLKQLNRINKKNINDFFFKGDNLKVPRSSPEYDNMSTLLKDPRINDLVCEAALMKE
jgi:hypothetical protein